MALTANLGSNYMDWCRRLDNGKIAKIGELMNMYNGILADISYKPSNLDTGHKETVRTGLPEVYNKSLGEGVPTSKSTTKQVMFDMSLSETRTEVDEDILMIQPDPAGYRTSENVAAAEAMAQHQAKNLFYGNSKVNPKEHMGLAAYYADPSKANGYMMVDCGGRVEGIQTDMWLVGWSDSTVFGIFPKNSTAGIAHNDLGRSTKHYNDELGVERSKEVYMDRWTFQGGLVVKDWRYAGRLCNIEVTPEKLFSEDANGAPATVRAIINRAVVLKNRVPSLNANFVWYVNSDVFSILENQAFNRPNTLLNYTADEKNNGKVSLCGITLKKCQCIKSVGSVINFN